LTAKQQSRRNGAVNLAVQYSLLVAERGYDGSMLSVRRSWAKHYPAPVIRAQRRVGRAHKRRRSGRTSRKS
jgi:hypothetical protein